MEPMEVSTGTSKISHQGRLRSVFEPQQRAALEEEYRRDRERLTSEQDGKVTKARSNPP